MRVLSMGTINRGLILFVLLFLQISCGDDKKSSNQDGDFGDQPFFGLATSSLKIAKDKLEGEGKVIFENPIGEILSAKNYFLRFKLAPLGSLSLYSHTDNKLKSGLKLTFSRDDKNGLYLTTTIRKGKSNSETVSSMLHDVDASTEVAMYIDIHNNETPAHVVIWGEDEDHFHDHDELYNSEKQDVHSHGKGAGMYWGLELNDAAVFEAKLGDAKFDHHHEH